MLSTEFFRDIGSPEQMTLEEKVGLILLSRNSDHGSLSAISKSKVNIFSKNNFILDGIDGFSTDRGEVPFPDIDAIAGIRDGRVIKMLREDLLYHVSSNGFQFVLGSNDYLFKWSNYKVPANKLKTSKYALWVFTGDKNIVASIPVNEMPSELFSREHGMQRIGNSKNEGVVLSTWADKGNQDDPGSFEDMVDRGYIFLTDNYEKDHSELVRAYRNNMLVEDDLDKACRKILRVLRQSEQVPFPSGQIPSGMAEFARRIAFGNAVRLYQKREESLIPEDLNNVSVTVVSDIDPEREMRFRDMVQNHIVVNDRDGGAHTDFVFWLHNGVSIGESEFNDRLSKMRSDFEGAGIVLFLAKTGRYFQNNTIPEGIDAIFTGSSDWPVVWEYLAQGVCGGLDIMKSTGLENRASALKPLSVELPRTRLNFGIPEEAGLLRDTLGKIDEVMREAVEEKATPGGQIVVVRDGIVVWNRAYGHHTYKERKATKTSDIYDVASVTKVSATLPSLMKLYEMNRWMMNDSLGHFFPQTDTTEKAGITLRDLLLHESGLPSFIPFYLGTVDKEKLEGNLFSRRYSWMHNIKLDEYVYLNRTVKYRDDVFSLHPDSIFSVPVAANYFLNTSYLDSIMTKVISAPMRTRHNYLYSDLGFYFLGELIPRLTGIRMNDFARQHFYAPLGMGNTAFLPLDVFDIDRIVPTEDDKAFRKQLLQGWVHDPGAAMMGGMAGHAGLFSNATDLAKIMQMYLNKGTYGGKRFLNEKTVDLFTSKQNGKNRRGLGFDKPQPDTAKVSPASKWASPASFGHSGFTGTLVWADPEYNLVYIFLSNRIHPNQYNRKLIQDNYRTRIQDIVYRAIIRAGDN